MKRLSKVFCLLVYLLPLILFFSYYPVISFGADSRMNFELSLPLIWLVVFDVIAGILMLKRKILFKRMRFGFLWLLLPLWLSLSVIWSLNNVRGILTVGILWLIYFAGYGMWRLRDLYDEKFRIKFWKWFFGSALFMCGWCILQCVLDVVGVSREYTLMCVGCTYKMFGFPHPNGFAIEPQFMGNLLLAPAIMAIYFFIKKNEASKVRIFGLLAFAFVATLFLTFSRGAIYAFVVGLVFLLAFLLTKEKKNRGLVVKRVGKACGIVIISFLFTLNLQGVMTAISPTNDNYVDGVAKVINHLSLGIIDIRGAEENVPEKDIIFVSDEDDVDNDAVFDGYVAESTDIRMELTSSALETWSGDFRTMIIGVGLGGAAQAMYEKGLTDSPKEIVQNQYASLLLESGIVGVILFVLTIVLVVRVLVKTKISGALFALTVAYGVSLCFFAGLPNVLHIYLLLFMFGAFYKDYRDLRK